MSYTYTDGQGLAVLDKTTPNGATEPVSILDDAIRQIKAFMKDTTTSGLAGLFTRVSTAETNIAALQASNTPVAAMVDYAGSSSPAGWLLCDGTAVSRTTYANLFAVVGISFGPGNGTTTFNLPDFRGRVSVAADGGTGRVPGLTQGASGGAYQHTLVTAETPVHDHFTLANDTVVTSTAPTNTSQVAQRGQNTGDNENYQLRASAAAATLGKTSSVGTGSPHNNMQPYLGVATKIIKY